MALHSGVAWIDLKDPDGGSLGAADAATAAVVGETLRAGRDRDGRITSAALGELSDTPTIAAKYLAGYFPLLKVGLSGLRDTADWPERLSQLYTTIHMAGAQLVPVIYADHHACRAPRPEQVIEVAHALREQPARRLPKMVPARVSAMVADAEEYSGGEVMEPGRARYVLIDTFTKDGRRLLDWMAPAELESIVQLAAASGRQTVVAGSLALQDLPQLMQLPVAAIAVRGAVCAGDRRSGLCAEKLRQWVELFAAR